MIAARGLSFSYLGSTRPALDTVDLDLAPGAWGLLLGPSGAGKSTLVRTLNRTIPQFFPGDLSGDLLVAGRDVKGRRVAEMAGSVGVVLQDFETQIFSSSCLLEVAFAMENRGVPADRIRRRAPELLARVGLGGFEARDPTTLSGGEKQRLVIASVLALDAPLLVLDEPASDLDPGGRDEIYRLVGDMEARTVLLVEHDLEGVPAAGPGTLLSGGRIEARWDGGTASGLAALAPALAGAGVRPPPIASLASALSSSAGAPLALQALSPEAIDRALEKDGWRLETAPVADPAGGAGAPAVLRCEAITHVYPGSDGGRAALDGVDLTIREGEMVAIIGANGSGKTTLARHLDGLQVPTSGRVLLRNEEVRSIPARRRAREIGFVFQNPDHQIFAATVREEVAFGPRNLGAGGDEIAARVASSLDVAGLTGAEDRDPFTLTKGERQRLALASVLACEPSVIIMDEPTTGLDLRQQAGVMDLLARLNARGHTVLIITHALWLLRGPVRRALVMIDGKIAADGRPRDLLTDEALMASAGLRMPDLARLSRRRGVRLLTEEEWIASLRPPRRAGGA